jgi:2-desacetyl-2-hydroxyethyl bacteriochlorophyllide A dehydrogenase
MLQLGIEYAAPGEMRFYDTGAPGELTPTQILIETRYSGITNGTERHALTAELGYQRFPSRHGYQHVGCVTAIGDAVRSFQPGDVVYFGRYVGHRGWHVQDVAHADPHAYGSHLCLALPPDVDHSQYALLGVAGVAMRHVRRCRVAVGQNVWVVGAGLIGQFVALAARAAGARVTVTDVNERRLEIARTLGAHGVLHARDPADITALKEGGPYDRIIDASGAESLLAEIHEAGLLAYGGVIGCLAVRTHAVIPWSLLHGLEASVEVSCHYSLDDLRAVLHCLRLGSLRIEPLISHRVPIAEAPAIYATLRDRPAELLGVMFDWTG